MQRLFQNRQIKNGYKDGGSAVHMFIFFVEICFFKLVGLCLNYFIPAVCILMFMYVCICSLY